MVIVKDKDGVVLTEEDIKNKTIEVPIYYDVTNNFDKTKTVAKVC